LQPEIFLTADGSSSLHVPSMEVTYHSRYGAITESMHVYINAGFLYWHEHASPDLPCHVLEVGFGTGLNALLTLKEAEKLQRKVFYTAIESNPLDAEVISQLNYVDLLNSPGLKNAFSKMHSCGWENEIFISPFFLIQKIKTTLQDFSTSQHFNVVFYDAFAPNAQPELWTKEIFEKLFHMGNVLVTYCSKGEVQRAMKSAGYIIEKLTGPPGKREMIRAHHSNV
jgi:tRNA U34 5-methylaminomethyl-2-thiouridine-forming methyltransferase MnmC